MPELCDTTSSVAAGVAAAPLIADPRAWINRRVETIELLSHEETRRKVSIDFTLSQEDAEDLTTPHGVVVPISVLTKEPRRNFDLRDESGRAVPVLGRSDNGNLAHVALLASALEVLPDAPDEAVEAISSDLRAVVHGEPEASRGILAEIATRAAHGTPHYLEVWGSSACRSMLETLTDNYVLFAVLAGPLVRRRVLKYSYGEYFDVSRGFSLWPADREEFRDRARFPDRRAFLIDCPAARRARSFHVEIAVPEELRIRTAFLVDRTTSELVSEVDRSVDRASLYAEVPVGDREVDAYLETVPERAGVTSRAAGIALSVSVLLWAGGVNVDGMRRQAPRLRQDAYYIKAAESRPTKVVPKPTGEVASRRKPSSRDRALVAELRGYKKRSA